MTLSGLLSFLQQRDATKIEFQMNCSFSGVPLSHIDISEQFSIGLDGKLQISLRLSEILLQFMLSRTTAAEVAHSGSAQ